MIICLQILIKYCQTELTVILSWPGKVTVVKVQSPKVFVSFILCPHRHHVLVVALLFLTVYNPETRNIYVVIFQLPLCDIGVYSLTRHSTSWAWHLSHASHAISCAHLKKLHPIKFSVVFSNKLYLVCVCCWHQLKW